MYFIGTNKAEHHHRSKAPSTIPSKVYSLAKNVPEFARGAHAYELNLIEAKSGKNTGFIYVFIGGAVKYHAWSYTLLTSVDYEKVVETFEALEPTRLLDYLLKAGYESREAVRIKRISPISASSR